MASIETQTKIGLISKALVLCGEAPLVSLSDNRYGATVGAALFEMLYENELQSNRWRFACKKNSLSRLTATPINEWQYAYQMPTDMLLPLGIYGHVDYELYSNHLYTNASSVILEYMFKPDITRIPAYFSTLLTYALARDMVKPITESDAAVNIMHAKYVKQRDRAMYADAQGRPNRDLQSSPFTDIR